MRQTYLNLLFPIYLPGLMSALVQSATVILLPLYMLELGHGIATASFVVAVRGIGMLIMDLPAGILTDKLGGKASMIMGNCINLIALIILGTTNSLPLVMLASGLLGVSLSFGMLGRLSYISDVIEAKERGRVIALMAGLQRGGTLLGPLLFGIVAESINYQSSFLAMVICIVIAIFLIVIFVGHIEAHHRKAASLKGLFGVMIRFKKVLLTIGFGGLTLMMMRIARSLLLPLFGYQYGLNAVEIGLLFSLSSIIDMMMFYPAGQIMDRKGRKWTVIPGMIILTLSFVVLALLPNMTGMLLFAVLSGLGNGITTGVLLTIGSDLAPDKERGQFLGIWRVQLDIGMTSAPLMVGALAEATSLTLATFSIVGFGFIGVAIFIFMMDETLKKENK